VESHAEFLRQTSLDDDLAAAIRRDWREAGLDAGDRALCAFAEKLTRAPATVAREDVDALRAAGFDDTAISQATMIASFFNYVNRVADGLGVAR
jgi:uncharacterized peroxidase-related enzyme